MYISATLYTNDDCTATWQVRLDQENKLVQSPTIWDREADMETTAVELSLMMETNHLMVHYLQVDGDQWRDLEGSGLIDRLYKALLKSDIEQAEAIVREL